MNVCIQYSFFPFYFFLLFNNVFAQQTVADSSVKQLAVQQAIQLYSQRLGSYLPVYNGVEYVIENEGYIKGHQYFQSDVPEEGNITYDGITYYHIPLLYDINKDFLLTEQENSAQKIKLHTQKVNSFSLAGHTFIRLQSDTIQNSPIRTGFYDQLYTGDVQLFAKRTKNAQQATRGVTKEFLQKNSYFILIDAVYYPVKNKASVLKVFKAQKKALQKYFKESNINFQQDPEFAMIKLVEQYNRLVNPI